MNKQCGTCRWWNSNHVPVVKFISACMNPAKGKEWLKPRKPAEGQDCLVYEERKL